MPTWNQPKRRRLDTASHNASSVINSQQWRNDLMMIDEDQPTNQEVLNDPNASFPNQVVAQVCCSQTNCDKVKIEAMPEQFFNREPVPPPTYVAAPGGRETPGGKPGVQANIQEPYIAAYCPCAIVTGDLLVYCCLRHDCDDASKIEAVPRRVHPRAFNQFKF